jgi:hypothetical protein
MVGQLGSGADKLSVKTVTDTELVHLYIYIDRNLWHYFALGLYVGKMQKRINIISITATMDFHYTICNIAYL